MIDKNIRPHLFDLQELLLSTKNCSGLKLREKNRRVKHIEKQIKRFRSGLEIEEYKQWNGNF